MRDHEVVAVDAFDLPEWLGVEQVTWTADTSLGEHRVQGTLHATPGDGCLRCDLLAGDLAHPLPVLADAWRTAAHRAWALGEVLLVDVDRRLTLVLPGSVVTAEPALEALRRLARAVGADAARFGVFLRL